MKFKAPSLVVLFGIFMILIFMGLVYYHEQTHKEIYRHYGIKAEIHFFKYFPDAATIPEAPCPSDECILAHNNTDSIGYHLMMVYWMIAFGILFMLSYLEIISKQLEIRGQYGTEKTD